MCVCVLFTINSNCNVNEIEHVMLAVNEDWKDSDIYYADGRNSRQVSMHCEGNLAGKNMMNRFG